MYPHPVHEQLAEYWSIALDHSGIEPSVQTAHTWADIMARLSEPHRKFHTARHVVEVCRTFLELAPDADWIGEGLLAAIMHDVVYRVHPNEPVRDNESKSAAYAAQALLEFGAYDQQVALVIELILRTAEHRYEGPQEVVKALLDADMSILGSPPERYAEYRRDLREEYAAVSDEKWREGRTAFLRKTLEAVHIFHLDAAQELFEERARSNMRDELERLAGSA